MHLDKKIFYDPGAAQGAADGKALVKEMPSWVKEDIMYSNNQKKTGGLTAGLNRSSRGANKGSLSNLKIVRGSAKSVEYVFPKRKLVPAGKYHTKIVDVLESVTKNGDQAIDVHYDFDDGAHRYHIKMRYPLESSHFEALCEALINAGVPENANITRAVDVEEMVELDYPNGATIGSIVSRSPVMSTAAEAVEEDDYDMLDDEEDDDLDVD